MTSSAILISATELESKVAARLREAQACEPSLAAATRAMMHASIHGIDSHGVRLTEHYCNMLQSGRISKSPNLSLTQKSVATAVLDGDNGLGHYAAYRAVEVAGEMASKTGIAMVGVIHSSHFGAAGAYTLAGAEAGFVTFVTSNADSVVALHDSASPFHGTNPLSWAAPLAEEKPWHFDMATSSIPMNRVLLHRSKQENLPPDVAATKDGEPTCDPDAADMLLPLGGADYGYKGAGLAGVATLFSAILTGTKLDGDMISMLDPDNTSQPRNLGHNVIAVSPSILAGEDIYFGGISRYVTELRRSRPRDTRTVMAPGDREWREREKREAEGVSVDHDTARFLGL